MSNIIVSVIIPLYYGKKYINEKIALLENAFRKAHIAGHAEIIFVNDSPDEDLSEMSETDFVRIVTNEKNEGIHHSRVNGLLQSRGAYIHFLDQDDEINIDFYKSQLQIIRKRHSDVLIANGIYERDAIEKVIYHNFIEKYNVLHASTYFLFDNRIISPGQCLLKRNSIPKEWCENILDVSGADDFLLWIIMFEKNRRFAYNDRVLYIHKNTGKNFSAGEGNLDASLKCVDKVYARLYPKGKYRRWLKFKMDYINGKKNTFGYKFFNRFYKIRFRVIQMREKHSYE